MMVLVTTDMKDKSNEKMRKTNPNPITSLSQSLR